MRTMILALLVLLAWPALTPAELHRYTTATLQDAVGATADGRSLDVEVYNSVAFQVTITNTATVTFEATADGSTVASLACQSIADTAGTKVTTATASGIYQCNVAGLRAVRARISAFTSGTVTVKARASTAAYQLK